MKRILTRALPITLAALMLLTTAVACSSGPDPDDDPGYIFNQSNTETPENEITAFYNGNKGTLTALATDAVKDLAYVTYSYSCRMTDYEKGTVSFFVQKQLKPDGAWAACDDEVATRLTDVKFVGTVTYQSSISKDVVLFTPRSGSDKSLALVYCASAAGKSAVESGKFHKGATVKMTEIEKNWYCIEVTAKAAE